MFFEILLNLVLFVICAYGAFTYGKFSMGGVTPHLAKVQNDMDSVLLTGIQEVNGALRSEISTERRVNLVIALKRLEKTREETIPRIRLYSRLFRGTCVIACTTMGAYMLFFGLRTGHQLGQLQFIPIIHIPYDLYVTGFLLMTGSMFASSACGKKVLQKAEEIDEAIDSAAETLIDESAFSRHLRDLILRRDEDVRVVH